MQNSKRTVTCGELRKSDVGKKVVLNGWVSRTRDLGGLLFIRLRDRYGITQVMVGDKASDDVKKIAASLKREYCIAVEGVVNARADKDINADMATGEIEVEATDIEIFTTSQELPFSIEEVRQKDGTLVVANEDLRLKYRYLDLRRDPMQHNIILRSQVAFATREYLTSKGFLEIETPTFIKSTPEGARDYLVPSRVHPGKFYSLPQSPQLYKQLLMVSGFDKYFQIARCYRDEDARGDRQPEFTQIDMEMSFTNREEVLSTTEGMMGYIFKKTLNYELPAKFDRIAWENDFPIDGRPCADIFAEKAEDFELRGDIQKACRIPTESVLFNIQEKLDATTKSTIDPVLNIFVKEFNRKLGYDDKKPEIAEIERYFDNKGKYEYFKQEYERRFGETWENGRKSILLKQQRLAELMADIDGIDYGGVAEPE